MKIGILSDTHNKLPEHALLLLKGVDLIFHAGDIGQNKILSRLKKISPVYAVYGNADIYSIATKLPSKISCKIEDLQIFLLHNVGNIKNFVWKIKRGDYQPQPDIVIFGHTHQPIYKNYGETLFINPGSAGVPRSGYPASLITLTLKKGTIEDYQLHKIKQDAAL